MLVLKTTSPPVSPGAPAASPSYQIPFSSASVAFMRLSLAIAGACHSSFVFQRAGHAGDLSRGDQRGHGPQFLAGHLDSDDVLADGHFRQIERRRADFLAV